MKRNILWQVLALSIAGFGMTEKAAAAETEKEEQFSIKVPEKVTSWHEQGKKEGKKVHDAIEKGEMLTREVLLVYAMHLATEHDADGNLPPAATDFLTGYASAWSNPNSAKARKTEAKAVFDAFAMRDEERELVVGYEPVEKGSKESPKPIKETHAIGEWLLMHQIVKGKEGYRGLVDFAKELRGPASGRGAGGGANRGPRAVTSKQQDEIVQRIEVMNPNQAHTVAVRATAQLAKLPNFEIVMFRQVMTCMEAVSNKSTDAACKQKADMIWNHANEMVERLKAAMSAANTGTTITGAKPAGVVAPAPATTGAPISESGTAGTLSGGEQQQKAA